MRGAALDRCAASAAEDDVAPGFGRCPAAPPRRPGHRAMNRRELLILGGGAVGWPFAAYAQQNTMAVIGLLGSPSPGPAAANVAAFRQGLSETGYVE
jgi:hypothetical protein